jgi:hypothetical protein
VTAGAIADAHGYGATFLVCAAVALAPLPLVAASPETLKPAGEPPAAPALAMEAGEPSEPPEPPEARHSGVN